MATIVEKWVEQGVREGLLAGIEVSLELKLGADGLHLLPEIYTPALRSRRRIEGIEHVDLLRAVPPAIRRASSPDDLRRL
ncbi:MAG: hypothetical protein AMXMBFR16_11670 [Candidatus Uhrbacteria bacterium]